MMPLLEMQDKVVYSTKYEEFLRLKVGGKPFLL